MYVILFFFFNDTATTEIYTLSLHDALPIYFEFVIALGDRYELWSACIPAVVFNIPIIHIHGGETTTGAIDRSEEHTSELQSRQYLVCRLLLEKKKKKMRKLDIVEQK